MTTQEQIDAVNAAARLRAEEEQRRDLASGAIPELPNPFGPNASDYTVGGGRGTITLALESILVMFWPQEYRHEFFNRVGYHVSDAHEEEMQSWARLSEEPLINPDAEILEIPRTVHSDQAEDAFREADAMYVRAMVTRSQEMNASFRTAAAETGETDTEVAAAPVVQAQPDIV